jgi:hypothetical protein
MEEVEDQPFAEMQRASFFVEDLLLYALEV